MATSVNKVDNKSIEMKNLVQLVSTTIERESGNVLGKDQESMVMNRLQKRMIDLGDLSPIQYDRYLKENHQSEVKTLISMLTTHHTFFFREFSHFEYIKRSLPDIVKNVKDRGEKVIQIYSAACSRGQEVYSLAMFFKKHLPEIDKSMTFKIFGSDIDPESVKFAQNGVYPYQEVKSIPSLYLAGNWMKGTGSIAKFAKVTNDLKQYCEFSVVNLMDIDKQLMNKKFDIIMCRNVFIYFSPELIKKICLNFEKMLHANGVLISGLSESLNQIGLKITTVDLTVYSFSKPKSDSLKNTTLSDLKSAEPASYPRPIRMLIVDDSPIVTKILNNMFSSDPDFKVMGTAENGLKAEEFLRSNTVDAITLDIHMPEMDGVSYLKKNFNSKHPKVVVVSSASREDMTYAQKAIDFGAADFVEKPALNNLNERADEIKTKIKMSFTANVAGTANIHSEFNTQFIFKKPEQSLRTLVSSFSQKQKVVSILKSLQGNQPPVCLFFEGNESFLTLIKDELKKDNITNIEIIENPNHVLLPNKIYLADFKKNFISINNNPSFKKRSIGILGECSKNALSKLVELNNCQLLVEDQKKSNNHISEIATDIFPWTSFAHVATEYLSRED